MNLNDIILAVEPGHGKRQYTVGKHSVDYTIINGEKVYGCYEGEWARLVVPKIVSGMRQLGIDARQTVTEDGDPSLTERCWRVNQIIRENPGKKVYFLSVHLNAAGSGDKWQNARGVSAWVAENASVESKALARIYWETAIEMGLKGNRSVPKEMYKEARFTVLTGTKCPAVLTENLFQDNYEDSMFVRSPEGREIIVNLHIAALCKFFGIPVGICSETAK